MNKNIIGTRIFAASDLHQEFHRKSGVTLPEDADVIVLAGDIDVGNRTADIAVELSERYPAADIVWVAGNHEFYYGKINEQIERYREVCAGHHRVHYLENDSVDLNGIRFLGCTLWTDFSLFGEADKSMEIAGRSISDFAVIETTHGKRFTPADAASRFKASCNYLEKELASGAPEKTVVITHFSPGFATRNQTFEADPITAYFQSNVNDIIDRHQPALWIYGHNHYSNDLYRGATRLVSNQLGYPGEAGHIPEYSASKVIVLN
jgi:Icc-related predicted phosphoesterase